MTSGPPKHIGDVLSQLLARRGYARVRSANAYADAWREAVGEPLSASTRATQVRRGVLEVMVSSSMMAQELGFQKAALLAKLAPLLPDDTIRDLKFKVGPLK